MPIQEALIRNAVDLRAPCGVSFDTPGDKFGTKTKDRESWEAELEATAGSMEIGWVTIALIQTRNTRSWNPLIRQYRFNPQEDYLVSGWLVSEQICNPYRPGTVMERWFGGVDERIGTPGNTEDVYNFWNCDDKSCKLSKNGPTFMITSLSKDMPEAEAVAKVKNDVANSQKFGWKGGCLEPRLAGPKITFSRSKAPNYQAPMPPGLGRAPNYQAPRPPRK